MDIYQDRCYAISTASNILQTLCEKMSCPVGAAAGRIKLKRCSNEKQHEKTTPEPLRAKWLARNKTIIIITEASDERILELLRLFDDGHRLPGS